MVWALLFFKMVEFSRGNGDLTRNMERDISSFRVGTDTKENIFKVGAKAKVNIIGKTGRYMMDNGSTVLDMEQELGVVSMATATLASGKMECLMDLEYISGQMVIDTKDFLNNA